MIITLFWIWILFDLEFASHNAWKTVGKLLLILGKGQGLACRHPLSITVNIWTSRWALQTCYTSIRLIGCCKYSLKTWRNAIMLQQGCWRINSCSAVCVCVCTCSEIMLKWQAWDSTESRCSIMRHVHNALSPISANGPQGQQVCSIASCHFNEAGHICLSLSHTHAPSSCRHTCACMRWAIVLN